MVEHCTFLVSASHNALLTLANNDHKQINKQTTKLSTSFMPFRSIPIPQFPMPQTQDLIVRIFVAHVCSKKRTQQQASHPAQEKDEQKHETPFFSML